MLQNPNLGVFFASQVMTSTNTPIEGFLCTLNANNATPTIT